MQLMHLCPFFIFADSELMSGLPPPLLPIVVTIELVVKVVVFVPGVYTAPV